MDATAPDRESGPQSTRIEQLLELATAWARQQPDIRGLALVGSWARGSARADSDVDLVALTTRPNRYLGEDGWTAASGATRVVHTQAWARSPNDACCWRTAWSSTSASPTRHGRRPAH